MKIATFVLPASIALGIAVGAVAQEANPFDGQWSAKVKMPNGHISDANATVKGNAGTFEYILPNRVKADACMHMQAPIAVSKATADELEFVIKRSAIPGCTDAPVKLHRVDAKTLEGKLGPFETLFVRK